ncbi:MAG: hypothetical protein WAW00_03535 [Candidatus Moraniibacteriota bacterium]
MRPRLFDLKKLFDWWSVPHFLFGMVTALTTITFSFPIFYAFFATLILALLWELLETRYRISEAPGNGTIDVILPLIAFGITFLLVDRMDPNPEHHRSLLIVVSILYLATNFFAWRARLERDREFLG